MPCPAPLAPADSHVIHAIVAVEHVQPGLGREILAAALVGEVGVEDAGGKGQGISGFEGDGVADDHRATVHLVGRPEAHVDARVRRLRLGAHAGRDGELDEGRIGDLLDAEVGGQDELLLHALGVLRLGLLSVRLGGGAEDGQPAGSIGVHVTQLGDPDGVVRDAVLRHLLPHVGQVILEGMVAQEVVQAHYIVIGVGVEEGVNESAVAGGLLQPELQVLVVGELAGIGGVHQVVGVVVLEVGVD